MATNIDLVTTSTTAYKICHCSPKFGKINGSGTGMQNIDQRGHTDATWYCCTWKDPTKAAISAASAIQGAENKHIGYSQSKRRGIFKDGMGSTKQTYADCVSFVELAGRIATGNKKLTYPGAWSASLNAGKSASLKKTGLFENFRIYKRVWKCVLVI